MKRICIVSAKRTPQGRFLGALSKYQVDDLGVAAGAAALEGIDRSLIDMVIVGRVLPPDLNVARIISRRLEIPHEKTAFTVNMMCGSGMKAATGRSITTERSSRCFSCGSCSGSRCSWDAFSSSTASASICV